MTMDFMFRLARYRAKNLLEERQCPCTAKNERIWGPFVRGETDIPYDLDRSVA